MGWFWTPFELTLLFLEWLLNLSVSFFPGQLRNHSEKPLIRAVSGSNVSHHISNLTAKYQSLTLFYNRTQKILEWDFQSSTPEYFETKFKDRVALDRQNGTFYIYKVEKEDSSQYILKVMMENGTEKTWEIRLCVLDPVANPVIKIEKRQEVNNNCYLTLSCLVQDKPDLYTWYRDSGPFPEATQNSKLEIIVNPQNFSKFYTCQVSNLVSQKNDTVYFTSACTPASSSGVAWIATWLVVTVLTILGQLLI